MRVLVAFDKFKDALTAAAACRAVAEALRERHPGWTVVECPQADGGEGFASILTAAAGGREVSQEAMGPRGERRSAGYGRVETSRVPAVVRERLGGLRAGGELAVIEMAAASGLGQVPIEDRDVWQATSVGTGQLIAAAAEAGVSAILLGVGGSATHDVGTGALAALGLQFVDAAGQAVYPPYPKEWHRIVRAAGSVRPLPPLFIACDVANPLLGPRGAATVYGPQKGLKPEDVARLESETARIARMLGEGALSGAASPGRPPPSSQDNEKARFAGATGQPGTSIGRGGAAVAEAPAGNLAAGATRQSGKHPEAAAARDPWTTSGGGAAGGISYGLMSAGARLVPGAELISDWLDLDRKVAEADLVITGEGRFDDSSIEGKGPGALARAALARGKNVLVLAGSVVLSAPPPAAMTVTAITPPGTPLREALKSTEINLRAAVARASLG